MVMFEHSLNCPRDGTHLSYKHDDISYRLICFFDLSIKNYPTFMCCVMRITQITQLRPQIEYKVEE